MNHTATHRGIWRTTRFDIDLSTPQVMGIVNVTPDSFADAAAQSAAAAIAHCEQQLAAGADILDIGAESTRPGAAPLAVEDELARIAPVLRHALTLGVPVSVDTRHAAVMREVLAAGADIINDVCALRDAGAEEVIAGHRRCGVCLMHMRGEPATMQADPRYDDVVAEVGAFLAERAARLCSLGVGAERIVVDPGFGFGKTACHNITLHRQLRALLRLGFPVLVGWSRKGTLGTIIARSVSERMPASVAAALSAAALGARVLRVHDVGATRDALKVWSTLHPTEATNTKGER